jgi:hypothetical protein
MDDKTLLLEIYQKVTRLEEKLDGYQTLKDKVDELCRKTAITDAEFCAFKKLAWLVIGAVSVNLVGVVFIAIQKMMG